METKATTVEVVEEKAKRDRLGRRIVPRERVEELLAEYERSEVTQAEFARRAGVKYQTFASWVQGRRQRGKEASGPGAARPRMRFAQVAWTGAAARLSPAASEAAPPTGIASDEVRVSLPGGVVVAGAQVTQVVAAVRALQAKEVASC